MRNPDLDYRITLEHRKDILAEVAHDHLVREAVSASRMVAAPRAIPRRAYAVQRVSGGAMLSITGGALLSIARLLSWIGGSMLTWGCRLQYRYDLLTEVAAEKRVSPCA
jgi:hypothetical protein